MINEYVIENVTKGYALSELKDQNGNAIAIPVPIHQNPEYIFVGWNYNGYLWSSEAIMQIKNKENRIYTAIWEGYKVTLTFFANGGTFGENTNTDKMAVKVNNGTNFDFFEYFPINNTDDCPIRDGHTFVGWSRFFPSEQKNEDNFDFGAIAYYSPSQVIYINKSEEEKQNNYCYALWHENNTSHEITLDLNGGLFRDPQTGATTGDERTIKTNTDGKIENLPDEKIMTRAGYQFTGWKYTFPNSSIKESITKNTVFIKDGTIVAQWKNTSGDTPLDPITIEWDISEMVTYDEELGDYCLKADVFALSAEDGRYCTPIYDWSSNSNWTHGTIHSLTIDLTAVGSTTGFNLFNLLTILKSAAWGDEDSGEELSAAFSPDPEDEEGKVKITILIADPATYRHILLLEDLTISDDRFHFQIKSNSESEDFISWFGGYEYNADFSQSQIMIVGHKAYWDPYFWKEGIEPVKDKRGDYYSTDINMIPLFNCTGINKALLFQNATPYYHITVINVEDENGSEWSGVDIIYNKETDDVFESVDSYSINYKELLF